MSWCMLVGGPCDFIHCLNNSARCCVLDDWCICQWAGGGDLGYLLLLNRGRFSILFGGLPSGISSCGVAHGGSICLTNL